MGIEQLVALVFQLLLPRDQAVDVLLTVGLDALERHAQVALDLVAVIATEPYLLVELGQTGFHLIDEHCLERAVVYPVPPSADEVVVGTAGARGGVLHQQAGTAQAADDGALEMMIVRAMPLAVGVGRQDVLHRLPGGSVHERLMRPGVLHPLEGNDALVVGFLSSVCSVRRLVATNLTTVVTTYLNTLVTNTHLPLPKTGVEPRV